MLPPAEQKQIVWIILEAIGRLEAGKGKLKLRVVLEKRQ